MEIRAMRRFRELKVKNPALTLDAVSEDLRTRDARDSERELAPLKAAGDAIVVDNSELSLEEAVDAMAANIMG
jgi:cytidylate kinase